MATPRKHWFRVADSVAFEPWSNDAAATFMRLGAYLNTRWARDGKNGADGGSVALSSAVCQALTGSGSLARARRVLDELATHVSLTVTRQGTNTLVEWPKFAEFQRYESEPGAFTISDDTSAVPPPQDAPAPARRKTEEKAASEPAAAENPEALKFAEDFEAALVRSHPGFKPPAPKARVTWAREARLLIAERGEELTRETARWLFDASVPNPDAEFWRGVILSLPKFREKFEQLAAKRRTGAVNGSVAKSGAHTSDLAERARAYVRERGLRVAGTDGSG